MPDPSVKAEFESQLRGGPAGGTEIDAERAERRGIFIEARDEWRRGRMLELNRFKRIRERLATRNQRFSSDGTLGSVDFQLLVDLSRNTAFTDRKKKFGEAYPEGFFTFIPMDNEEIEIYKRFPEEPWREVNPTFGAALLGNPEVVLAALARRTPLGMAVATAIGVVGRDVVEAGRGYPRPIMETAKEAALTGSIAAAGPILITAFGAVRAAFAKGYKAVLHDLISNITPKPSFGTERAVAAQRGAPDTLPALSIGEVGSPMQTTMYQQAGGTSVVVAKETAAKVAGVVSWLKEAAAAELTANLPGGLTRTQLTQVIVRREEWLRSQIKLPPTAQHEASLAETSGIHKWYEASGRELTNLYYDAILAAGLPSRASPGVTYNIREARGLAADVTTPVMGPRNQALLEELEEEGAEAVSPFVQVNRDPTGEFAKALEVLNVLDDTIDLGQVGGVDTAFITMTHLRERFHHISLSSKTDPETAMVARSIHAALVRSMENPVGGAQKFGFVGKNKAAIQAANTRETLLAQVFVRDAMNELSPEKMMQRYVTPGNFTAISTMKSVLPPARFETIKAWAVNDFLTNPAKYDAMVQNDPNALALLMNSNERLAMERAIAQKRIWEQGKLKELIDSRASRVEMNITLLRNGSKDDIVTYLSEASRRTNQPQSPELREMRASVYEYILNRATHITETGSETLKASKFFAAIQEVEGWTNIKSIMRPEDMGRIKELGAYLQVVSAAMDFGGVLQRGVLASSGRRVLRPMRLTMAWVKVFGNNTTARILALPARVSPRIKTGANNTLQDLLGRFAGASIAAQRQMHIDFGDLQEKDK